MVSKASELFPDPETPLITVSLPCGISQERFFRLCVRALRIMMASFKGKAPRLLVQPRHHAAEGFSGVGSQTAIISINYAPTRSHGCTNLRSLMQGLVAKL